MRREECEYFQFSPYLTWRGFCVIVISCEKGEEGAASLETCPSSAGLPPLLFQASAAKIYC